MRSDEQKIRDVVDAWHRATRAEDLEMILSLMAEDAVFLTAGHPPMRGRDAFAAGFKSAIATMRIESRGNVEDIHVSGNLGYAWTQLSVAMIDRKSGKTMKRTGPTLSIFRKEADGRWVLIRDANLLTPAES